MTDMREQLVMAVTPECVTITNISKQGSQARYTRSVAGKKWQQVAIIFGSKLVSKVPARWRASKKKWGGVSLTM